MTKVGHESVEKIAIESVIREFPDRWIQAVANPALMGWFVAKVMLKSEGRCVDNDIRQRLFVRVTDDRIRNRATA